jgi:uncharacterized protein (UPF0276 family)
MTLLNHSFPFLGFGLGLRPDHYADILENKPTSIQWFEVLTENYLIPGGKPLYFLDQIKEHYPLVMHGVSMSLGSSDPLDLDYLKQVKALSKRINAHWLSDHVCWTGIQGKNMHDLLPMPYTEEAIKHFSAKVRQAQDFLEQPILIENASSYLTYQDSPLTEWDFITAITKETGCYLLLDVNNIYVSGFNHDFDPMEYIRGIPKDRVKQIHLAGHTNNGDHIIDTHDHDVIDPVWNLYSKTLEYVGKVSTMIERDDHIPPLATLIKELEQAKHIARDHFPDL